jgi:ribulose-bisphosphate carboxylase large chain
MTKLTDVLFNLDKREEIIRKEVEEHLSDFGVADTKEHIVATYFIHTIEGANIEKSAQEIARLQTSGEKFTGNGTRLQRSTGYFLDSIPFNSEKSVGLVRIAFPVVNIWDIKHNTIYSSEILHILAGAVQFDFPKNVDIKLVDISMSEEIISAFPGPAFGPKGLRGIAQYGSGISFGTIGKPKTGLTADEYSLVIAEAARNPLFLFVKDDENYGVWYEGCPLSERVKRVNEAIKKANEVREKGEIIYAPHIGNSVQNLKENIDIALDNGATAIMFSEIHGRGGVRLARDYMIKAGRQVPIYGHNGGITPLTRVIYREILDMFARLDGIDIRQTGPIGTHKLPLLRPYGREWEASERLLTKSLGKHKPVMVARAGGLDQGNIILNFHDIKKRGYDENNFLMLAGSAINEWKDEEGKYNPKGGAIAMEEAIEIYENYSFDSEPRSTHVERLYNRAKELGYKELVSALKQRYPERNL